MKILTYLTHPADYHMLKNAIREFIKRGHNVMTYAREKDVLVKLLEKDIFKFKSIKTNRRKDSIFHAGLWIIEKDIKMYYNNKKFKPDILIGNCINITHMGKIFNKPSILIRDDDKIKELFFGNILSLPFASVILTPESTNMKNYLYKQIFYKGFKELSYLHPNRFIPNIEVLKKSIDINHPYFIIRSSGLSAYHDIGKTGITKGLIEKILKLLSPYGNIYISSEENLDPQFEKYNINLDPQYMHHALYYADMYIGDSQTMAAEAAVLGTPSLRFNDFVGKLGYLEELEHKYGLTFGFKTSEPERLLQKIEAFFSTPNLQQEFQIRRQKMLSEKIDVTDFMVWFIENYPNSVKIMKENPDYQYNFK